VIAHPSIHVFMKDGGNQQLLYHKFIA